MADVRTRLARLRVPLGFVLGAAVVWLAHPTLASLAAGATIAALGELIRLWAAGHLEKGREVTRSGPYRFIRHPLYAGSALIAIGVAVASARWMVAALVVLYLAVTILSAIQHEEANMRAAFGSEYDDYVSSRAPAVDRSFSPARAFRNREYRAVLGLIAVAAIFAFKASRHL
jgi:protein-S-isoprenylcysteine O-methyltransferase Ste14